MTNRFSFPVILTPDAIDGGFVVTFPDLPEAITQGNTLDECIIEATDCLEEAIAARIDDNLEIPFPSTPLFQQHIIHLPLQMSLKVAVYLSIRETGMSYVDLAQQLQLNETEVRQIIDPTKVTKLSTIERILSHLGKRAEISLLSL